MLQAAAPDVVSASSDVGGWSPGLRHAVAMTPLLVGVRSDGWAVATVQTLPVAAVAGEGATNPPTTATAARRAADLLQRRTRPQTHRPRLRTDVESRP